MDTSKKDLLCEISEFLERGGDANHHDIYHNTWLHRAAENNGKEGTVQQLVVAGADLNFLNQWKQTPLHVAVIHRNRKVVKALIRFGARIDIKDCFGNYALHYAVHGSTSIMSNGTCLKSKHCSHAVNIDILLWLVQHVSADINIRNSGGYTPLMWAVTNQNFDAFTVLMSNGVDVNVANHKFETPLHLILSIRCRDMRIVTELLVGGACLLCSNGDGETPLELFLQHATDDKARFFAKWFLMVVAMKWQNQELIYSAVEKHLPFLEFYKTCVKDALEMGELVVARNRTLRDFVLDRLGKAINVQYGLDYNTCNKIVDLIMPSKYPTYFETIIGCMSEHELSHMADSGRLFQYKDTWGVKIIHDARRRQYKQRVLEKK